MLGLVSILGMFPLTAMASPQRPWSGNFSCPNSGTHCYGTVFEFPAHQSPSGTNFWGVRTAVDLQALSSANGSITNEIWLADNSQPNLCHTILIFGGGSCWVEVGYAYNAVYSNLGTHLFWADVRPFGLGCNLSCGYILHQGPTFTSADFRKPLGAVISLSISYAGSGNWQVRGGVLGGGTSFSGVSTNNFMTPTYFELGQELIGSGTSGQQALAPKADFHQTQEQTVTGPTGYWHYITSSGTPSGPPDNPPWSGWDQNDTPGAFGIGGLWYTCTKVYQGHNPC
jgi:hypothetical protein